LPTDKCLLPERPHRRRAARHTLGFRDRQRLSARPAPSFRPALGHLTGRCDSVTVPPAVAVDVAQPETVQAAAHRANDQHSLGPEQPKVARYVIVLFPMEAYREGHAGMVRRGDLTGGYA